MGYIIKRLQFTDFINKGSFNKLKDFFRFQDNFSQPFAHELEALDTETNFTIKIYDVDEQLGIKGSKKIQFLENFIFPNVTSLAQDHFGKYQRSLITDKIFGKDALEGYSAHVINDALSWHESVENAEYLNLETQKRILQQLDRFIQDVENHTKYPVPYFEAKLRFKWNKTDVLYFFHLLRENKQIEYLSNSVYGRIIDNIVEYKDEKGYSAINDSRKRISAFNQQTPPIVTESKNRLLAIFGDSDFYKE